MRFEVLMLVVRVFRTCFRIDNAGKNDKAALDCSVCGCTVLFVACT